jgi:coenzyme F420-reducing hydrogenase alpha subunit
MSDERTYKVDMLARVEGEGRFYLKVDDGVVQDAHLSIFEAPRFFEAFLRGRSLYEVPDIVARICGICPVAYQMSSVGALESALGIEADPVIWSLRRLLYCGEWLESHVLHIFLLHAPDYLGYPSAIEMAADHKPIVERGLRMKKIGNELIEILGGRAIHPISVRVGGFTKVPRKQELARIRPALVSALDEALETVEWTAGLDVPPQDNDYTFVALRSDAYPLERGDAIEVSGRGSYPIEEFDAVFEELHVERSNALHCRLRDGTAYLCGPMARINLFHDKLHPRALEALERCKLQLPVTNPYLSIIVRAIEVVHAFAEAIDIIDAYVRPAEPYIDGPARVASGCGATEAPRGLLYHRYEIAADGSVELAHIVPPTSQNQARIEQDLIELAPSILDLDHDVATRRCEQLIRAYDPCISCATHFLRLDIDRGDAE